MKLTIFHINVEKFCLKSNVIFTFNFIYVTILMLFNNFPGCSEQTGTEEGVQNSEKQDTGFSVRNLFKAAVLLRGGAVRGRLFRLAHTAFHTCRMQFSRRG